MCYCVGFFLSLNLMARIKPSALISDIRGKLGGSIFQKASSGLVVRAKCTPINKRSANQVISRNIASLTATAWLQLSASDREQWTNYVQYNPINQRNSKELFVSGQQAFLKFNNYRLQYSLPILTVPEFNKCELTPIEMTLSRIGMQLRASSSRAMVSADEFIILFVTVRMSAAINNPGNRYKLIKFVTTDAMNFNITSDYVDVYGIIPEVGDTVFIKYTNASKASGLPFPFKSLKVSL